MTKDYTKVYLIVPNRDNSTAIDFSSLRAVKEVNNSGGLDSIFFKESYNFPAVREYASLNKKNKISVHQVPSLESFLTSVLDKGVQGVRRAYLSDSDSIPQLLRAAEKLALYEIKTELRILFS